ncbi:MAG TPA: T9SS type B sorting domain-containing protein, partial [Flavobacteriaceae bacterium]|nr:T9SS type B sorting domain-containing protein [Flavobacteriaceae bacterium]
FSLEVNNPPANFTLNNYNQCDFDENPTDGVTLFNLDSKAEILHKSDPNLKVSFYENATDLNNNNPIINTSKFSSGAQNLIVKLENIETGCYTTGSLNLVVHPTSLSVYNNAFTCENYTVSPNGLSSVGTKLGTFDFETIRNQISSLYTSNNFNVELYLNVEDAQLQNNPLSDNVNLESQEIYVRISDKSSQYCVSVGKFNAIVNPLPEPNGSDEVLILCTDNPRPNPQTNFITLDGSTSTSSTNTTYQWYLNNVLLTNETNYLLNVYEAGTYKVEATTTYENNPSSNVDDSNCTGYNSFVVIESNPAYITPNDLTVVDDSSNNSITINTSNLGLGDYEYALDNDFSGYQDEPYFDNVEAGIHTLFIQDKKGCGITSIEVSVLGFPKFFSPNNDGINDTWNVLGVTENFYKQLELHIYNRYGKLVAVKDISSLGWDGTYNGALLPATDYWFTVKLVDFNNAIRLRKGHFSLIR